jgi:hypothetical protein
MARTLAIHRAQTTHGTWLTGDPRNSWHNGKLIGPDPFLESACRSNMTHAAASLSAQEREIVTAEFGSVLRECGQRCFAATIQPTHIHLVLAPLRENITTALARFKRRSSAVVLNHRREQLPAKMAGLYSRAILARRIPNHIWTARQFPVFIFDDYHLTNAIEYVRDHNRRIGLAPDPFDWIDPLYRAPRTPGERVAKNAISESLPL